MKEITKLMIKEYKLMKLGYDFMGYDITNKNNLSFHHLIVPHRNCKAMGLGEGYLERNGAILNQNTSHDYLHLIEAKDYDMFLAITNELIDENFSFRAQNFNFRDVFKNITDSLLNIASAIETKSIELIKVIKQNIVTLLNTTINFIDEKLYKKLYDLFNMLFQYVIKLSKKSYKEAQKLFNTFLKKAKKDRQ